MGRVRELGSGRGDGRRRRARTAGQDPPAPAIAFAVSSVPLAEARDFDDLSSAVASAPAAPGPIATPTKSPKPSAIADSGAAQRGP